MDECGSRPLVYAFYLLPILCAHGRELIVVVGVTQVCQKCDEQNSAVVAGTVMLLCIILGPIVFQIAQMARHLGALSGPVMSAINFFQTADLFSNLDLHWPASWIEFIKSVASIFNLRLPQWMSFINPECSFELAYFEKFILMMFSPFLLVGVMGLYVLMRGFIARLAVDYLGRYRHDANADATISAVDMDPVPNPIGDRVANAPEPQIEPEPEPECPELGDDSQRDSLEDELIDSDPVDDAPKPRCESLKHFCRELTSPGGPRRILINCLKSMAVFDRAATTRQMQSIFLVYLMVGYVALVSAGLYHHFEALILTAVFK
jgi:hypothetical protein